MARLPMNQIHAPGTQKDKKKKNHYLGYEIVMLLSTQEL